jgi:translocation and assembly module TamB
MRVAALALAVLLPTAALAQEDDRSYLTAFLEDNLSGVGRKVTITGFQGALSAQASIEKLEISDDIGVWITLEGVVLDWSRSSLLSGAVDVDQLTAEVITVARMPTMAEDDAPAPEAVPFALPDLPVSIAVDRVEATRIVLEPPVLGELVEGRLEASASLSGGEGEGALVLERTDGPDSKITLDASYSNITGALALDLSAVEPADGIAARLLELPGRPAVDLSITGTGTLADFTADVRLASDGQDRLTGPVTLLQGEDGEQQFAADLTGDLAPLFLPDYAAFLGDRVALRVAGARWPSGRVVLDRLALDTRALQLSGSAAFAGDGLPEAFDLTALLAGQDGQPVLLPLSGDGRTWVRRAEIALAFDATQDSGWTGKANLLGLETDGLRLGTAEITGSGRIARLPGGNSLGATLQFAAQGIALADAAVQAAVGDAVTGKAVVTFREGGGAVKVPQLEVNGQDYGATARLQIEGLESGLNTSGTVALRADDLSRFADLAGVDLGGAGEVVLEGEASLLSGAFDMAVQAVTQGLRSGIPQADRLTAGEARLALSALRDETGTTLRSLDLTAGGLAVTAGGKVSSKGSDLTGEVSLTDLAALDPAWGGGLTAGATFTGTPEAGVLTLAGEGRNLRIGQAELDRLLSGQTAVDVTLAARDGGFFLTSAKLDGANLTAEATGTAGSEDLQVTGRLRDLSLLAAGYPGPVSLSGRLTPTANGAAMDLRVLGPASIDMRVAGRVTDTLADLTIQGTTDAALLNASVDPLTLAGAVRADLALRGPLALSSLSGRITLSGGRVAYPLAGFSLNRSEVLVNLSGGRAQVAATSELTTGGRLRVNGGVGLTGGLDATLDIELEQLRLRDPELYDTILNGQLRIAGPLLGRALLSGRILVGETNLIVPSTGFSSAADLEAIRHVNDRPEVRATRTRAGVGKSGGAAAGTGGGGGGLDWALDLLINAPNRIFLRGRGLDAELGGQVRLGGTLRAVVPSGAIELIRGRLDLLGKRLELSQASLALEGDLVPYLTVVAANETEGVTSMVTIEGPANAPEVTFSSIPELPQEEVLAWLLFGRGLDTISVLQAAQLANAVAVLAGRGGEGVISKLRKGFGFDDLDVQTSEDGTASVSAGKYIARNIYTEIEVDQDGESQINLNLDLKRGLTVKGRVSSDGDSGIGVFLERDY